MPALKHGRDAARPGQADLERIGLDRVGGGAIVRIGKPGADLLGEGAIALLLRALFEISARDLVLHRLETMGLQFLECVGEVIDRIVRTRPAAVPAWIAGGEE